MSIRIGDTFIISDEPSASCELCGTVAELRPYGPGGKRICIDCGNKDIKTAIYEFLKRLEGVTEVINS